MYSRIDPINYKVLGKRIKEERKRIHLTQSQLANDVGISDTYMGAIERGERSLTLDTLAKLANRIGVTIDYLLTGFVDGSDESIIDEFKQIIDNQPLDRKVMALQVLRTIFGYFNNQNDGPFVLSVNYNIDNQTKETD